MEVRGAICEQQGVECGCSTRCQVEEQQAGDQRSQQGFGHEGLCVPRSGGQIQKVLWKLL